MVYQCNCDVCGSEKHCFVLTGSVVACKECLREGISEITNSLEETEECYRQDWIVAGKYINESDGRAGRIK